MGSNIHHTPFTARVLQIGAMYYLRLGIESQCRVYPGGSLLGNYLLGVYKSDNLIPC